MFLLKVNERVELRQIERKHADELFSLFQVGEWLVSAVFLKFGTF